VTPAYPGLADAGDDMVVPGAYLATAQEAGRTQLVRNVIGGVAVAMLVVLGGCGPSYSPNTYAGAAVQQANKVEQGVVVGVRQVAVSADAALGTVTGAAAGGIAGSQVDAGGPITALSALGGSVLGGVVGSTVEHATGDTTAFEYIVRQTNGDLVSVTQRDTVPLAIGRKVLVITGKQARVVADYTVALPGLPPPKPTPVDKDKPAAPPAPVTATPLPPASASAPPPGSASPALPPAATLAVPSVATPVAAALDASPPTTAAPPTAAAATPAGSPPIVSVPGAAQPGAPVSLALPVAPASPTVVPDVAVSPAPPSATKP